MSRKHGIIPDTQAKPGVPLNHMVWAGDYFAEKHPDILVHVGDHWDMASLGHYDKGTKAAEGRTYHDDIQAGNLALGLFMLPIYKEQRRQLRRASRAITGRKLRNLARDAAESWRPGYTRPLMIPRALRGYVWDPERHFCIGNHEQRIERHKNSNPELYGTLGYHDFNLEEHGWRVHGFLHPVRLDGVSYQHYVPQPNTGRPWGGMAEPRLKNIGYSFVSGHEQGKKSGERYLQNGTTQRALIVGSFYLHNEEYKGPQGNYHWRGIIMAHEVARGNYDLMEVSMTYLCRRYHEKYPDVNPKDVTKYEARRI